MLPPRRLQKSLRPGQQVLRKARALYRRRGHAVTSGSRRPTAVLEPQLNGVVAKVEESYWPASVYLNLNHPGSQG